MVGLLLARGQPPWILVAVATAGNVLGSAVNWSLGHYLEHFHDRPWFPIASGTLNRAARHYHRWGRRSLLSWVPLIGDPLTLAAGLLREPFPSFLAIVTIAKLGRYLAVVAITLG